MHRVRQNWWWFFYFTCVCMYVYMYDVILLLSRETYLFKRWRELYPNCCLRFIPLSSFFPSILVLFFLIPLQLTLMLTHFPISSKPLNYVCLCVYIINLLVHTNNFVCLFCFKLFFSFCKYERNILCTFYV